MKNEHEYGRKNINQPKSEKQISEPGMRCEEINQEDKSSRKSRCQVNDIQYDEQPIIASL